MLALAGVRFGPLRATCDAGGTVWCPRFNPSFAIAAAMLTDTALGRMRVNCPAVGLRPSPLEYLDAPSGTAIVCYDRD